MIPELCELLCAYRYGSVAIQHYHWQVQGPTSESDHARLGEVYKLFDTMLDGVGERIAGLGGKTPAGYVQGRLITKWSETNGEVDSMWKAYLIVQLITDKTNKMVAAVADEGVKNLLAGYADDLEQQVFFLRQRAV